MKDVQNGITNNALNSKLIFAGTAITCGDLVLLAKRIEFCPVLKIKPNFPGYWSIFCGGIEIGETPLDCAQRELKEETGWDFPLDRFKHIGLVDNLSVFNLELEELRVPNLCYEHTESGWFKKRHLSILPDPTDPKIIKLIQ